jgi:hypothetical protein
MVKKRGEGPTKSDDWGEMQKRMTRAIISEMRDDLDDLLAGLDAGSFDYIVVLKALKIQLLEGLEQPLVGAVEVKYQKVMIPIDKIEVPPTLKKKKKGTRRKK